jgi:hypothetical protein
MRTSRRWLRLAINMWPPFLGAGIHVKSMDPALRAIDVEMKLRFWNRNYVGTHYGGSLYSMVDPFLMVMLIENLGPDYVVWDKAATIRFKKPGRGKMSAAFRLSDEQLYQIRRDAALQRKLEPTFSVEIRDESGEVVAEVEKLIYIRLRSAQEEAVG